jgi:putative lipoprotein
MNRAIRVTAPLLLLAIWSAPTTAQSAATTTTGIIPPAIEAALREMYARGNGEIRYFAAAINLDVEGYPEIIVHVVGDTVCGSGGWCDTLVFAPNGTAFRHVATIRSTRPPIRVSPVRSHDWRNLILTVSGGDGRPRDVELRYDGTSYPSNPTTAPAYRDAKIVTQVAIPAYGAFDSGTLLALR